MAGDEPRRSGRATKGQHHKKIDESESTKKPTAKAGRGKPPTKGAEVEEEQEEDSEEDTIIRCICGYHEEDESDTRAMICCDKCAAWQHNVCMGYPEDEDDLPDKYFCEQCAPQDHQETIAAIARGEKPWEARHARKDQEDQDKKDRKRKGGRRTKGGRPSDPQDDANGNSGSKDADPSTKADSGQKRKLPPDLALSSAHDPGHTAAKVRKVSTPTVKTPKVPVRRQSSAQHGSGRKDSKELHFQSELVDKIEDLHDEIRRRAAKALSVLFVDAAKNAISHKTFALPSTQPVEAFALKLALSIEYALYLNLWGTNATALPAYGEKLRMMLHNVKANPPLRDNILKGILSPDAFSKMSSQEMARKELQEEVAQVMKQVEKQHTLIQEDGPRIRRTHKGDELVGADEGFGSLDGATQRGEGRRHSRRESNMGVDGSPDLRSPHSPSAVELPYDHDSGSATSPRPLTVDTKSKPRRPAARDRPPSGSFNMDTVWSSVESPHFARRPPVASPSSASSQMQSVPSGLNVKADPEIDHLLRDEDDDEPYSPQEYEFSDGEIWRGKVVMPMVASFSATARHVAGADLSSVYSWLELLPPSVIIEGRIDVNKASNYLCSLQWSKSIDVTVVALSPAQLASDRSDFDRLFNYFMERDRYGVIGKPSVQLVRDTYVVPVEAGDAKRPDFIELLEHCTIPEKGRPERLLLIVFVIKTRPPEPGDAAAGSASGTPAGGDAKGTMGAPPVPVDQRSPSMVSPVGATGFAVPGMPSASSTQSNPSPLQGVAAPLPPPHAGQMPAPTPPPAQNGSQWSTGLPTVPAVSRQGFEAAQAVLGPLATVPAVTQLLAAAPDTPEDSFRPLRSVLEEHPHTQTDLNALMQLLQSKMAAGT